MQSERREAAATSVEEFDQKRAIQLVVLWVGPWLGYIGTILTINVVQHFRSAQEILIGLVVLARPDYLLLAAWLVARVLLAIRIKWLVCFGLLFELPCVAIAAGMFWIFMLFGP